MRQKESSSLHQLIFENLNVVPPSDTQVSCPCCRYGLTEDETAERISFINPIRRAKLYRKVHEVNCPSCNHYFLIQQSACLYQPWNWKTKTRLNSKEITVGYLAELKASWYYNKMQSYENGFYEPCAKQIRQRLWRRLKMAKHNRRINRRGGQA